MLLRGFIDGVMMRTQQPIATARPAGLYGGGAWLSAAYHYDQIYSRMAR